MTGKLRAWRLHSGLPVTGIIAALFAVGCGPSRGHAFSSLDTIAALRSGIGVSEVQHRLGVLGQYQFQFMHNGDEWLAIEFYYSKDLLNEFEWARFTCLFKNGTLDRVCPQLVAKSATTQPTTTTQPFTECWLLGKGLEEALCTKAYSQNEIRRAVKRERSSNGCGDWGSFALVTGVWIFAAFDRAADDIQEAHYNPFKVRIGMTLADVERKFGTAGLHYLICNNIEIRIYGHGLKVRDDNGWDDETWIAVSFKEGRSVGIFHDDFVYAFLPVDHPARKEWYLGDDLK